MDIAAIVIRREIEVGHWEPVFQTKLTLKPDKGKVWLVYGQPRYKVPVTGWYAIDIANSSGLIEMNVDVSLFEEGTVIDFSSGGQP